MFATKQMDMKKNEFITGCLILALGIVILGFSIKGAVNGLNESKRMITVRGLAERDVVADKVIWPMTYKIVGNDLPALYTNLETYNQKIKAFLERHQISSDEISESVPVVVDLKADIYRNPSEITSRYVITSGITVTSSQIDVARNAMNAISELLLEGIAVSSSEYGTSTIKFLFTSLNEIKPDMIKEATENARRAAEKFADDSKSTLGKIRTATQGQFSITTPDDNIPYKQQVRVVSTIEYTLRD